MKILLIVLLVIAVILIIVSLKVASKNTKLSGKIMASGIIVLFIDMTIIGHLLSFYGLEYFIK